MPDSVEVEHEAMRWLRAGGQAMNGGRAAPSEAASAALDAPLGSASKTTGAAGAAASLDPEALSAVLCRVREGDREAFLSLTRAYQKKVFALAYAFFRNKEDALDLVQDTFLRLFQKIDTYQEGRNFEAWLLQVARNLCIDHYRKHHQKRREMECATPVDELPVADAGAEDAVHASDLKDILSRCVERLADRQRTIFIMRHYSELKNEEIARTLDISLGTVKSLHFKALQNLRALMEPYMGYRT